MNVPDWVVASARHVPAGPVLDLASGAGRCGRWFLARGHAVCFVDRDVSGLVDLAGRAEVLQADLEGDPWPLGSRIFSAVVVTNYLWRPLFPHLVGAVAPGGALIYETFGLGHTGKPSNPAFLLRPGELWDAVSGALEVRSYHCGETEPGVVRQGVCATRPVSPPGRSPGESPPTTH